MAQLVLTKETRDLILKDQELFGKVAKCLDVSVITLPRLIKANDAQLTQASVLQLIALHTGECETNKFLQEIQAPAEIKS